MRMCEYVLVCQVEMSNLTVGKTYHYYRNSESAYRTYHVFGDDTMKMPFTPKELEQIFKKVHVKG